MARLEIPIKVDIYKIEELIDKLKNLQTYKLFDGDEKTLVDRDEVVKIIADHVKAEVSPLDQRWIPCSERLPEEDTEVLISYRYKEGEGDTDHVNIDITSYGTTCFLKEWRQPFDYFHANYEVIAWMPLPTPYREGGQE